MTTSGDHRSTADTDGKSVLGGVKAMAHDYVGPPVDGSYLSPAEAENRMVLAFRVHQIDRAQGQALADQMIAKLEQLGAPGDVLESYRDYHA
jgi:hypothetical protein